MKKPELLAPAGNIKCLKAAIMAGCDAVYLAGNKYGARAFATNFTDDELIEAIKYAHLYGVKVYVTVNTLIYEREVDDFINYIDFLHRNNVDAILIQDIGMMHLIRNIFPNLEVHASTQMHIHNIEGVRLAKELGLNRVVLARETSIDDIKRIKKEGIEIEIFTHGALCVSYSGQCLMSSMIGGRSANRGQCAGSCRLIYDIIDQNNNKLNKDKKYPLSLKDLNTLESVGELIELGVDSLKIEGRMKRSEYVYLVISLYRKAIDSYIEKGYVDITKEELKELKVLYNRYFTKGFLFNEEGKNIVNGYRPNHMGIEIGKVIDVYHDKVKILLKDKVNINDGIRIIGNPDVGFNLNVFKLNNNIVKKAKAKDIIEVRIKGKVQKGSIVVKTTDYLSINNIDKKIKESLRKVSINGTLTLKENKHIKLKLSDGINTVLVESDNIIEKANKVSTEKDRIIKQISKLGDTIYKFNSLDIDMDNNLFVPIKILNDLRRNAIERLNKKRLYKTNYKKVEYKPKKLHIKKTNTTNVKISDIESYNKIDKDKYDYIYVDDELLYDKLKSDNKVILNLDNVIINHKEYNNHMLISELGSIHKYNDFDTDYTFNVVNSYSVYLLHSFGSKKVTLSYELDQYDIKDIIDGYKKHYNEEANLEIIVNTYPRLMTSKYNLYDTYKTNSIYLKDRFNNKYKVINKNGLMCIYDYKLINTDIDMYKNLGITNIRYQFNDYKEIN